MIAAIHFVALAFLAGNLVLHGLPRLPLPSSEWTWAWAWAWACAAAPLLAGLASRRPLRLIAGGFAAGFVYALVAAAVRFDAVLPPELEGRALELTGRVASLPVARGRFAAFEFVVEHGALADAVDAPVAPRTTTASAAPAPRLPHRVRLNLYGRYAGVRAGDRLRLRARLKRPRGYANPGAFDYERWLFMRGVGATGYARGYQKLGDGSWWRLLAWRQALLEKLNAHRAVSAHVDSVAALSLGLGGSLAPERGEILNATGTRHLFAVSGLHVGLVFGLFCWLSRALWSRLPWLRARRPRRHAALLAALPFAFGYALLAGLSLPTQRALVMLSCFVFGSLRKRRLSLAQSLSTSLLAVLLWDPFSPLSASFWLSFAAVAFIVSFLSASTETAGWRRWPLLQIYLSLAMVLPTLALFARGSLIAPLANLFAVPLVSFAVLPASLLATLSAAFSDGAAWPTTWLLRFVDVLFDAFWGAGARLAALDMAEWSHRPPSSALAAALVGVALLLALPRRSLKPLALVLLLPLLNKASSPPMSGDFEAVFLDVGQGLSVFVATHRHALLYDAGAAYATFDVGAAVVAPYLRARNVTELDALIVSHNDNDHAGGAAGVLRHVAARRLLGGESLTVSGRSFETCRDGDNWTWDGVRFEILRPPAMRAYAGNDASCVLKISGGGHSLLLTADVERAAERALARDARVASEVVLVPHHGSRTSSTPAFLDKVAPRLAVVTSGYRNAFGLPKAEVLRRYYQRGIRVFNTADTGALRVSFAPSTAPQVTAHRRQTRHYWDSAAE